MDTEDLFTLKFNMEQLNALTNVLDKKISSMIWVLENKKLTEKNKVNLSRLNERLKSILKIMNPQRLEALLETIEKENKQKELNKNFSKEQ